MERLPLISHSGLVSVGSRAPLAFDKIATVPPTTSGPRARWSLSIPQPMYLLDHRPQHLGIHATIAGQLRQQVAGLSSRGVSEPPWCLLLAHSDVQQLGDGTPNGIGGGVVAVHIQQRRGVAMS
jgi:hypothetical protein